MTEHKITADMAGCWLEGSQGWHNNYRVIDRAIEWGWKPDDLADVEAISQAYADQVETITLADGSSCDVAGAVIDQGGLSDEATDYLQSIAPDGYVFWWDAGELSLVHEDELPD